MTKIRIAGSVDWFDDPQGVLGDVGIGDSIEIEFRYDAPVVFSHSGSIPAFSSTTA